MAFYSSNPSPAYSHEEGIRVVLPPSCQTKLIITRALHDRLIITVFHQPTFRPKLIFHKFLVPGILATDDVPLASRRAPVRLRASNQRRDIRRKRRLTMWVQSASYIAHVGDIAREGCWVSFGTR